ncbi:leucyl aminopeptidase [Hirschia baltica]|uniref:Probable cytosol aminopeptidase n=1 Tax=Hirschia baltica (strain ATCC 49814 / DSM 5838 / IFAM 1418) TaxID=582402 RepID=C6XKP4_HIRBI|nr:leucyl aminopeptidase [Hirschia baltica]ACT59611.1 Leucyl aminopeptidase [Hirschia baltica ATCC 49814]
MKITFKSEANAEAIAYLGFEGSAIPASAKAADEASQNALSKAAEAARFEGKAGQIVEVLAPAGSNASRILIVGLGKEDKADDRTYENAGASLVKKLLVSGAKSLDIVGVEAGQASARLALGARLASYRFDNYRTTLKDDAKPTLSEVGVVGASTKDAEAAWVRLSATAEGTELARDLVNEPPNTLHPESYAERIKELEALGLEVEVLDEPAMAKLGMGSLLGVGQGSVKGSRLVVMKWNGGKDKDAAPLALVGKGVTFDTGGISLKPGLNMQDMKGDMGGSAAVVGAMKSIATRKAKANVVGLVGLVENMPDGNAIRPGDILTSAAGKTIEIQNTDAEGRLVLVDVLWYAQEKHKPRAIIDLATLTGAILVALGDEHAGVFSNNDEFAAQIDAAGKAEGETVWRMPLSSTYDKQIDSDFADMRNMGGPLAGSATAAQFLGRFIENDTPWAHLDIAGVAWRSGKNRPMEAGWASGFGPRLLDRIVADNFED